MLKEEFEKLVGHEVPDEEYRIIEDVYTYHPVFDVFDAKQQCAALYNRFGFLIFMDMHASAMIQAKYENDRRAAANDFNERMKQIDEWYEYEMYNRGDYKEMTLFHVAGFAWLAFLITVGICEDRGEI